MAEADFPTRWGHFRIMGFEGQFDPGSAADRRKEEAVALVMGDIHSAPPLVQQTLTLLRMNLVLHLAADEAAARAVAEEAAS